MDFSKLKNKLLIVLCVLIVFLPFYLITPVLADTEEVEFNVVNNLTINGNTNYFEYSDSRSVGYVELEEGYIYTITSNYGKHLAFSNSIPSVNVTYSYVTFMDAGSSYSFIPTADFLYFDFSTGTGVTITRRPVDSMNETVNNLVENVGIQSLWNTFNDANPFILVVVLFSFGLFIIIALVRKLRKGKGGF